MNVCLFVCLGLGSVTKFKSPCAVHWRNKGQKTKHVYRELSDLFLIVCCEVSQMKHVMVLLQDWKI